MRWVFRSSRLKLVKLGSSLLTLGALSSALSAPATLNIGTVGKAIHPAAVNGFNVGYDMSIAEARQAVHSVAPSSLRYPPGNVGDENDLTLARLTSFRSSLQLATPQTGGTKPLAVVETRAFATRSDARNRPEDAAQAARDAKSLGLKVAYWEIGNEPDLYSKNRGDASWTPQRYCQTFRAQREAILKVDPQAQFAGPAVSNVEGGGADFLTAFVKECGDLVDLLTWHEYPSSGGLSDEAALVSASRVTEHLERFRALLDNPESNPLGMGRGRSSELGVTEYSLSYQSNRFRHLADMVAALWAAETTLRLAEGGAALSQYFALIGSGGHGLVDLAGIPRPTLYAFEQLKFFRGEALEAHTDNPELWVHAARAGQQLTVLVSNIGTAEHALNTPVPGYSLIGAKSFDARTVDDEAPPQRLKLEDTVNLPARSFTRLVYKRHPAA